MAKYLTVPQYKLYPEGLSLQGISDVALALKIAQAESQIDAYMGFDVKTGGFEPGVRTAQSQYDIEFETRRTPLPNPYLPARAIDQYRIQVSNSSDGRGVFATVNPNDVVVNNFQNYLEIVPLQALTWSVFPGVLDFGLKPPLVEVDIEQGFYLIALNEPLMDSGNHQFYYALRGFWATTYNQTLSTQPMVLPPIPPVLKINGNMVSSGFTLDTTNGTVLFAIPNQATDTVTCSYTYQIPDQVRSATVLQTSYLLQRLKMNQMSLYPGIQKVRSGDQELQAPSRPMQEIIDGLCQEAAALLEKAFTQIGVAG